jgi:hypothetical protein
MSVEQFIAATDVIFSEDEMALLSGIIAFWFGSRQWGKSAIALDIRINS